MCECKVKQNGQIVKCTSCALDVIFKVREELKEELKILKQGQPVLEDELYENETECQVIHVCFKTKQRMN